MAQNPGWYNDATNPDVARWYDGERWTEHTIVKSTWKGPGTPPPPTGPDQPAWSPPPAQPQPFAPPAPTGRPRAAAAAAKAQYKAMRPWWKKKRFLIPLIGLGGIVGCSALISQVADEADKDLKDKQASIDDDVTLASCTADDLGFMQATVDVVNNSSERSNYVIDVAFESEDGTEQYGSGTALINGLDPGQSSTETANSLTEAPGPFSCDVNDVTRFTDEP